jgi:acyl carrier protein
MNTRNEIEQFILDDILFGARTSLDPGEPLVSSGILDSMAMLRLITFLESRFNVRVGDGEVGAEQFGTLDQLVAFVGRKQAE